MMDATIFQRKVQFRRSQLEGIMNDCLNTHQLILSSGVMLNNHENEIRDELTRYLSNDDYKTTCTSTVRNFHVDTEIREGEHGRTDIRFLKVIPYENQNTYYTIECKRLDGSTHLNNEYIEHGIRRFTTPGKYETPLGFNAMMGFLVRKLDVPETCSGINEQLPAEEQLLMTSSKRDKGCYGFESKHNAIAKTIVLFHLWLDFSANIKQ